MNSENKNCCSCAGKIAYAVAVLGAILIVVFINHQLKKYTQAAPLNANRAGERSKALSDIRTVENDALGNTGWVDQSKGIVRLKIEDAMKLVEQEWKNPAAARSNLITRVEKANPPPPPPAPTKPSALE
jgi:hypothetical protein